MIQAAKPKLLLHKLSFGAFCLALASPLRAAQAKKDEVVRPATEAAPAKRFGSRNKWVIGMEGVADFHHQTMPEQHMSFTNPDGHTGQITSTGSSDTTSLFSPRLGVDWFVLEHFSVGLAARYDQSTMRGTTRLEGAGVSGSSGGSSSSRALRVSPRIGVAFASAAGFGVWARAELDEGTSWYTSRSSDGGSGSLAGLAGGGASSQTHWSGGLGAGLEALGTYTPREDIVLMAGPWINKTLATFHDANSPFISPDEADAPPAYGLTVGAGLFL
ncbi:MAG TPA: hypothetical protein VF395_17895 [Polyangiaceae bacterium]